MYGVLETSPEGRVPTPPGVIFEQQQGNDQAGWQTAMQQQAMVQQQTMMQQQAMQMQQHNRTEERCLAALEAIAKGTTAAAMPATPSYGGSALDQLMVRKITTSCNNNRTVA
jgi:hypothetical protein